MSEGPEKLRFVHDSDPGISRRWRYRTWHYFDPDGPRIRDKAEIERLNGLAVPPAYEQVWYCRYPNGHLQATGRDAKGRKQYRYHPDFRAAREADKFSRTAAFGEALTEMRRQVEADLRRRALSRERMLAATVRLLDIGHIRVGNESYARTNETRGATTLTRDNAEVRGDSVYLEFTAKGGKERRMRISDASLARLARRCQDLPGQHLFAYEDEDGDIRTVGSSEVNEYIREAMGEDFTAKHFRTWHASAIAFREAHRGGGELSLKAMLTPVAEQLGNTLAISRKSYVHPKLIETVKADGGAEIAGLKLPRKTQYLAPYERGLIEYLNRA